MTVIALAGQPNVGKSTVFNELTGSQQHVGNWPGKTVEKKEGFFNLNGGQKTRVIDLPGTYSLSSHTIEEIVTRDFLIQNNIDLIINVVDTANLERNLYLFTELVELGRPVIVLLNMMDLARQKGYQINIKALSEKLGVSVIPVIARRKEGFADLYRYLEQFNREKINRQHKNNFCFSLPVEESVENISSILKKYEFNYLPRWMAIKFFEADSQINELIKVTVSKNDQAALNMELEKFPDRITRIAEERYQWINNVLANVLVRTGLDRTTFSDHLDLVFTERWLGAPLLMIILAGIFLFIFKVTPPLQSLIGDGFVWLSELLKDNFGATWPPVLMGLLADGILAGVGTAMSFIPLIFITFAVFGLLEDVGYFARAAFVMDRLMGPMGLPGKSFISLLLGYGCNVAAVLSARTAENRRDQLITILLAPLTICSARQVVAVALIGAFFRPSAAPWVMLGLYVIGFVFFGLVSFILKHTVLKAEKAPFFIELPMYRLPDVVNIINYSWCKTKSYFLRATTYIAAASALIWFLANFPQGSIEQSILGVIGKWLEPAGYLLGLDWRLIITLISGFAAKETMLATLGVLYHASEANIGAALTANIPFATGLSFFVFTMFYVPCLITLIVIHEESGSVKWTALATVYPLVLAFLVALVTYRLALIFS